MEDSKIIELFNARSERAIDELSKKYGTKCMQVAYNVLGNKEDSEECVNDAYLGVWDAIPPENPNPLVTFVLRIVKNTSLKRCRYNSAKKRADVHTQCFDELDELVSSSFSVEEQYDMKEVIRAINEFLRGLSRENQMLFIRRYWYMDSYAALSEITGMSEAAIRKRLSRIRTEMVHSVKNSGGVTIMNIDVNTLITAIDGIDDSFILEFSDTEELKKEFNKNNKNRKVTFKRLLLVAIISTLLIVAGLFAVSSSQDNSIIDLRDGIYKLFGDRDIEIIGKEFEASPEIITPKTGDLVEILEKQGFPDVVLPTAMLTEEWAVEDYTVTHSDDNFFGVSVNLANDCYIDVAYFEYGDEFFYERSVNEVKQAESIMVNGMEVMVVEHVDNINMIRILYHVRNTMENGNTQEIEYTIVFDDPAGNNLTFEDALEIAKTLA